MIGLIAVVRRVMEKRDEGPSDGGDVIAYLLLALSFGTAAFALAQLGVAAFPGDSFVLDTSEQVAASLAALVVATPIAVFLWRRQSERRQTYPRSPGWTVYLALIEAVFMTALVIAAFAVLDWLLADGGTPTWTNVLVFGGAVVFHELATRRTPPLSDGAELPRVVGSVIGLISTAIGLAWALFWLFERIYSTLAPVAGEIELGSAIALLLVGAPVWIYRWWRPWPEETGLPRDAWTFIAAVAGLATALGAATTIVVQTLDFTFTQTRPAGSHFESLPVVLAVGTVGALVWVHHRQRLGTERTTPVRAYEYSMTALGLATMVGAATALTAMAFGTRDLVAPGSEAIIAVATALVVGAGVWLRFWSKASRAPREMEAAAGPRRFYLLGLGIVMGLVSAGSLIATLVVLFQLLLGSDGSDTLAVPASLSIYAGLATWHLLRSNAQDRELIVSEEVVTPFSVTLVCSHPGMIAAMFPREASLKVIYRSDGAGQINEEMAAEIVAAVGNRSSVVWVDEDGFRVAPAT